MKNLQNNKKILIDGRLLSNSNTGISRYTVEIIRGAHRIWGYDNVTVIINQSLTKRYFKYVETTFKPFSIKDFFFFDIFLKKQKFDLLFSPFYANSYFKIKGKIYVSVVHDLMYELVPNFFSSNYFVNSLAKYYYNFIVKRTLKNSDSIISVSKTTKRDILSIFGYTSRVFNEGINILESNEIEDDSLEILSKNNLKQDGYFLYVGLDRPHKNLDFLCSSFINANINKKLVLCGKHKKQYESQHIIDLGYVNDDNLRVLYKNSTAFVFPSKYEGFGLPILEALFLGTKVMSSNFGALAEFDNRFVKFFDPYDQRTLIDAFKTIDDFKINSSDLREYLKKFNWDLISDQIMMYCKTLIHLK